MEWVWLGISCVIQCWCKCNWNLSLVGGGFMTNPTRIKKRSRNSFRHLLPKTRQCQFFHFLFHNNKDESKKKFKNIDIFHYEARSRYGTIHVNHLFKIRFQRVLLWKFEWSISNNSEPFVHFVNNSINNLLF